MNIYKFPYDQQTCSIIIGSWFQDTSSIKLKVSKNFFNSSKKSDFIKNPIWSVIDQSIYVEYNVSRFSSDYVVDDVFFIIKMSRGSLYYMISNVYPCIILNLVTLLTFFLPFALQASLSMFQLNTFVFCLN